MLQLALFVTGLVMIRSHIVPRFYLDAFTIPEGPDAGKLWVYEKRKVPRLGLPTNEACERGYFAADTAEGSDDSGVEHALAEVENRAAAVLRRVHDVTYQ